MKTATLNRAIRREQGFDVHVLGNEEVELSIVPELGARMISLRDLRTGREWMWHPAGGLKLFRNQTGDDFSRSTLAGMDECLPTISPCTWEGLDLPDHGEVWSTTWRVDTSAWENGLLKTSVQLKLLPFAFQRTIELNGNEILFSYQLSNLGATDKHFLWAMHPLLRLQAGDQIELPSSTRAQLNGAIWVDDVTTIKPINGHDKIFATDVSEGWAAIANPGTGDRLEFAWNPAENNTLGLWLSRGGWHGHEHFALEPMNAGTDALSLAAEQNQCGIVPADGSLSWQVRLRVG